LYNPLIKFIIYILPYSLQNIPEVLIMICILIPWVIKPELAIIIRIGLRKCYDLPVEYKKLLSECENNMSIFILTHNLFKFNK